jgi:hypothetical protein
MRKQESISLGDTYTWIPISTGMTEWGKGGRNIVKKSLPFIKQELSAIIFPHLHT